MTTTNETHATLTDCPAWITGDEDITTMDIMLNLDAGVDYYDGPMVLVRYLPIDGELPTEYAQPFWVTADVVPEASIHWAL